MSRCSDFFCGSLGRACLADQTLRSFFGSSLTAAERNVESTSPSILSARRKALRRPANSRQWIERCRCAPRPGCATSASGSSTQPESCRTAVKRSKSFVSVRCRHPMQVRTTSANPSLPLQAVHLRCPTECRCANRSASPRASHFGPPCRSPATIGSLVRRLSRHGLPDRRGLRS